MPVLYYFTLLAMFHFKFHLSDQISISVTPGVRHSYNRTRIVLYTEHEALLKIIHPDRRPTLDL